jgi:hypothetical protein
VGSAITRSQYSRNLASRCFTFYTSGVSPDSAGSTTT